MTQGNSNIITTVLVAVIALGAGWYVGHNNLIPTSRETEDPTTEPTPTPEISIQLPAPEPKLPVLAGLAINVPGYDNTTTVVNPETDADSPLITGSFTSGDVTGLVTLIDNRLTAINENSFLVPIIVGTENSGTNIYLGLLTRNSSNEISHTNSAHLGSGIGFESLAVEQNRATVVTAERYAGQDNSAEPKILATTIYQVRAGTLILTERYFNVSPKDVSITMESASGDFFPIQITGHAPKSWFFEGDFPIRLQAGGLILSESFATQVEPSETSFFATITGIDEEVELPENELLTIVIERDNASDDRSLDAYYTQIIQQ